MPHPKRRKHRPAPHVDNVIPAAVDLVNAIMTGQPIDKAALATLDLPALHATIAAMRKGTEKEYPDPDTNTLAKWGLEAGRRYAQQGR